MKFVKWVKKHRLLCTIVIALIAIALILLPQLIVRLPMFGTEKISGIELIVLSSQLVSAIFVIIGTVIAVWQYWMSSSQAMNECSTARVHKAIELSNYYKENVLTGYSYVRMVLNDCGILKMLQAKRKGIEIRDFDVIELKEFYTDEEIHKIVNLPSNQDFVDAIIKINAIKGNTGHSTPELIQDFYFRINQTLNSAEYFAMAFTHNTADESVIYQSIYPTYLEMCYIMYYYIASTSDPAVAKLYTNLAELYNIWRKREQEQKAEIKAKTRTAGNDKGTVASKTP